MFRVVTYQSSEKKQWGTENPKRRFKEIIQVQTWEKFYSTKAPVILANIGNHRVSLRTHIVSLEIPLLLSKSTWRKDLLNLYNNTITFLGDETSLKTAFNYLYYLSTNLLTEETDAIIEHIVIRST